MQRLITILALAILALLFGSTQFVQAERFKIGIMQDKAGVAQSYAPMLKYFESKGVDVTLQGYRDYVDAAVKFEHGGVDAMVAGSGVAGSMIIKGIAYPIARPVSVDGTSTYWAVILAPKGSPPYTGGSDYFDGKEIICSSLASSGEFFARSILGPKRELLTAGSHGIAIKALSMKQADIAIVKNRVWDSEKEKFPSLEQVGEDKGENPNNTMIISNKTDKALVEKVKNVLLGLADDNSPQAMELKESLRITGYIPTTEQDFLHTLNLLKEAGVTRDFQFAY
ncbi:MAG: PhnD/SsuA/transferrin family substrate-binding protein [Desulfobulbaceae bacterium]|nr:PhnD/SsuA/transferrin family substrate-binding protein [Desulfobulbaceae bacterium]